MSELEQVPFGDPGFADNPEPRCPCVLLLDTSGSMGGPKIAQLNEALRTSFAEELRSDSMAAKRGRGRNHRIWPGSDSAGVHDGGCVHAANPGGSW